MSHEDINEASGDSRIQSGADSGADGQNTEIRGSENHDISRIADQGVEHDRRFDSEGDGSPVVSTSLTHMEVTSGPLPSSKELAGYEQTLPGAADRILRMAEDSLHSEIDSQKRIVESMPMIARRRTGSTNSPLSYSLWFPPPRSYAL